MNGGVIFFQMRRGTAAGDVGASGDDQELGLLRV
jgi:hypothetical protein